MMDLSYLKNFINHIYLCKITIQEIHVLIFLQLDDVEIKELYYFSKYKMF